jgi:hypothetical protein
MAKPRYLKNAWARKDADGEYWLFIKSEEGQAMFRLSDLLDSQAGKDSIARRVLESWLAEQDSTNGKGKDEIDNL